MVVHCECGVPAVARCSSCDRPRCHGHMTHTFGAAEARELCLPCAEDRDRHNTVERQRIDVHLLQQDQHRKDTVQEVVDRLVEAGSPGAVPHVRVIRRRLLPAKRVSAGIDGFPIGTIRYRYVAEDPGTEGAVLTDEAEALVLTDGRVVLVGGDHVSAVDQGVVRDRIQDFARRHGVALAP